MLLSLGVNKALKRLVYIKYITEDHSHQVKVKAISLKWVPKSF